MTAAPYLVLNDIAKELFAENAVKGFWEKPETWAHWSEVDRLQYERMKKLEKLMLVVTELSEGVEGIRKDAPSDKIPGFTSEEEEVADAFIRLFDYSGGFKLRIAEAMLAKLAYNRQRPYKHGKAL